MKNTDEIVAKIHKLNRLIEKLEGKQKQLMAEWMSKTPSMPVDKKAERFKEAMERVRKVTAEHRAAARRIWWNGLTEEEKREHVNKMHLGRVEGRVFAA